MIPIGAGVVGRHDREWRRIGCVVRGPGRPPRGAYWIQWENTAAPVTVPHGLLRYAARHYPDALAWRQQQLGEAEPTTPLQLSLHLLRRGLPP